MTSTLAFSPNYAPFSSRSPRRARYMLVMPESPAPPSFHPAFSPRRKRIEPSESPFSPRRKRTEFTPSRSPAPPRMNAFIAPFARTGLAMKGIRSRGPALGTRPVFDPTDPDHTQFRYSGHHLYEFDDAKVPYELSRGQVIPCTEDHIYFAGVDAKYKEVAGFGGVVEGRTTLSGVRAGHAYNVHGRLLGEGEDMALGALREFTEESMNAFTDRFTPTSFYNSPFAVIEDTLVILLTVDITPEEALVRFNEAVSQHHTMMSNAFRETLTLVTCDADDMEAIALGQLTQVGGYPLWSRYVMLLSALRVWYGTEF